MSFNVMYYNRNQEIHQMYNIPNKTCIIWHTIVNVSFARIKMYNLHDQVHMI